MSDLEGLRKEMDLLWGPDHFGRPASPHPPLAIAVAMEGYNIRFAPTLSDELRTRMEAIVAQETWHEWRSNDPSCGLRITGGPSFLMHGWEVAPEASFRILDSGGSPPSAEDVRRPEPWGDDAEWAELLAGRLGPWALALRDERVVGVCYTPVASLQAAEAGVWTDAEERGRGCGPLVTAAWANAARHEFATLF
ncbi:hypothetical protein EON79_22120, partial [bacterium]